MPIQVACPSCGAHYQLKDDMSGKKTRCKCGQVFQIPAVSQPPQTSKAPIPSVTTASRVVNSNSHVVNRNSLQATNQATSDWFYIKPGFGKDKTIGPLDDQQVVDALLDRVITGKSLIASNRITKGEWITVSQSPCYSVYEQMKVQKTEQPVQSQPGHTHQKSGQTITSADLAKRWPANSLILICHACQHQSLVARDCPWCGYSGNEFGAVWESSPATDGGKGYFCKSCNHGNTSENCPNCGTYNANNCRTVTSKAEETSITILLYLIIFVVLAFVFFLALNE
jgi:hypothetical protein